MEMILFGVFIGCVAMMLLLLIGARVADRRVRREAIERIINKLESRVTEVEAMLYTCKQNKD